MRNLLSPIDGIGGPNGEKWPKNATFDAQKSWHAIFIHKYVNQFYPVLSSATAEVWSTFELTIFFAKNCSQSLPQPLRGHGFGDQITHANL